MYPPPSPPTGDTLKSRPGQVGSIIIFLLERNFLRTWKDWPVTITPLVSFLTTGWVVELVPIRLRMRGASERKRSHRCGRFVAFDLELCVWLFLFVRLFFDLFSTAHLWMLSRRLSDCSTLLYSILLCSTLLYSALLCFTLLYSALSALLCSTLLYSALLCSTLLYSALLWFTLFYSIVLCNTPKMSVILCNTL